MRWCLYEQRTGALTGNTSMSLWGSQSGANGSATGRTTDNRLQTIEGWEGRIIDNWGEGTVKRSNGQMVNFSLCEHVCFNIYNNIIEIIYINIYYFYTLPPIHYPPSSDFTDLTV